MITNCPKCGTKLRETTWGRWFCPNCGIIEVEKPEENNEKKSYIG